MRIALLHPHELHDVNPATVIFSLGDSAGRETLSAAFRLFGLPPWGQVLEILQQLGPFGRPFGLMRR